jgi:hypothetical protein
MRGHRSRSARNRTLVADRSWPTSAAVRSSPFVHRVGGADARGRGAGLAAALAGDARRRAQAVALGRILGRAILRIRHVLLGRRAALVAQAAADRAAQADAVGAVAVAVLQVGGLDRRGAQAVLARVDGHLAGADHAARERRVAVDRDLEAAVARLDARLLSDAGEVALDLGVRKACAARADAVADRRWRRRSAAWRFGATALQGCVRTSFDGPAFGQQSRRPHWMLMAALHATDRQGSVDARDTADRRRRTL